MIDLFLIHAQWITLLIYLRLTNCMSQSRGRWGQVLVVFILIWPSSYCYNNNNNNTWPVGFKRLKERAESKGSFKTRKSPQMYDLKFTFSRQNVGLGVVSFYNNRIFGSYNYHFVIHSLLIPTLSAWGTSKLVKFEKKNY